MDIVQILETKALTLGYKFDYGTKEAINLFRSNSVTGEIYLFLSAPVNRGKTDATYGIGKNTATGSFLLVVKSNLDNVIYSQKEQDSANGKYKKNVLPLLGELDKLLELISCEDYSFKITNSIDAYDLLDANVDGLIVDFSFEQF